MPNNTVSDWSTTPASNTEVGGVDLAENSMRPRDVNNAIRTMMSQIATGIDNAEFGSAYFHPASASSAAYLDFAEDTDNGTNKITVIAPASVASDKTLTLPDLTATLQTRVGTTTDNAVVRYDGAAGVQQNSGVIIDDSNNVSGVGTLGSGAITASGAVAVTGAITNTVTAGSPVTSTIQTSTNFSSGFDVRKRGATGDADAAVANGGEIGYHSFYAWNGTAYGRGCYVIVTATEAWSGTARGCSYRIYTTPNTTTTNTLALTIGNDQSALFTNSITSNSPTAGVGYATGAGGTVTQSTNKSTGVTLSKASGQITMNGAALAAATIVSFTLTNTAIAAGDVLVLNHVSGGTLGAYTLNAACGAGSATITIRNNTAGSLSDALVIGFALIKGVTA